MRNVKYLMVIMVVFALVLSACSSDNGQEQSGANGPAITESAGMGTSTANDNLNGNLNDNGSLNGNDNGLGVNANDNADALATSTPASMATPLGTAMGTPAATQDVSVATETVGPLSTETPAAGVQTTPLGTETAVDQGDMMTYENGILLSNLIGADIEDANGDGWGTVDSVILDQATCTVPYLLVQVDDIAAVTDDAGATAVAPADTNTNANTNANDNATTNANDNGVTATTAPGMGGNDLDTAGGDLVLVPLSAFYADGQQGVLSLPLTISADVAEIVNTAPRYTEDTLPDWLTPDWDVDVRPLWTGYPTMTGGVAVDANSNDNASVTGTTMAGAGAVRLTDVTDLNVTNANGDDLGDIEDVVVMLNNQPAYVFLAVGGLLDMGERLVPIPCNMVTWQQDEDGALNVIINADQQMLENAPALDEIPAAFDTGWDSDYTTYWAGGSAVPATTPMTTPEVTATP